MTLTVSRLQPVTVNASEVDSALVDFAVHINRALLDNEVCDPSGDSNAQADGGDLQWFSDEGETRQPLEVVAFEHDSVTDADDASVELHGLLPSLSAVVDTTGHLGYHTDTTDSQPAANSTYGSENVWDANFVAVWHLEEDPSGSAPQMLDSTGNGHHGTSHGSMTSGDSVAGVAGNGLDFDGANDYIQVAETTALDLTGALTLEICLNPDASGSFITPLTKSKSGQKQYVLDLQSNVPRFGDNGAVIKAATTLSNGTWYHVAGTYSGNGAFSGLKLYINGAAESTSTTGSFSGLTSGDGDFYIGQAGYGGERFNGQSDEARVSNVERSAAWMAATDSTVLTPDTFASAGTPGGTQQTLALNGVVSAEAFGSPAAAQTIEPGGIGSLEAIGSAALAQRLASSGIASTETFGATTVALTAVQPTGIVSAEAIGAAALGHELSATGIAPAETVGSVAIAQAVSAAGISSAEALGDPVLSEADIRATGIASAEAFGTCQANQSVICRAVGVTVTGFSESEAAGTGDTLSWNHTCLGSDRLLVVAIPIRKAAGEPSTPTPDSVTYNGVAMSQFLLRGFTDNRVAIYTLVNPPAGTHQVSYTLLSDAADLIGSAVSLASVNQSAAVASFDWQTGTDSNPATTITATNGLTWIIDCITVLGGLAKSTDAGLRTLDDALQDRSGAAVQRVESAGAQSISWQNTSGASSYVTVAIEVAPSVESTTGSGIGSGESFGTAAIAQTIIPAEVESGAAFGTAAVGRQTVQASGIASGESFGAAAAVQGIQPAGSGSAEAFGAITVDGGTPVLQPTGIATGAAVGTPAVTRRIAATGIPSGAAIGTATVSLSVATSGVASGELVGQPAVKQLVAATGIASAEAHGVASVSVRLLPSTIPSAEALGTATVSTGRLLPAGIASGEAIGLPTVVAGQSVLIVGTLTIQPALSAAMTVDVALQGTINVRPAITAELEVTP